MVAQCRRRYTRWAMYQVAPRTPASDTTRCTPAGLSTPGPAPANPDEWQGAVTRLCRAGRLPRPLTALPRRRICSSRTSGRIDHHRRRREEFGAPKKEAAMRQVDCLCGLTLSGADDAELDRLAHEHVAEHHPNDGI